MNELKILGDSRLPFVGEFGRLIGNNCKTESNVRGMTKYRVKIVLEDNKAEKLKDHGNMDLG